jgi:hypothetical protein
MQDGTDTFEEIIRLRLPATRALLAGELEACAAESALIAGHVDLFRDRLGPQHTPFRVAVAGLRGGAV